MRWFQWYRSLRLRVALILGLGLAYVPYLANQRTIDQFSTIKARQFHADCMLAAYEVLYFLRDIGYVSFDNEPVDLNEKPIWESLYGPDEMDMITDLLARDRFQSHIGWALFNKDQQFRVGSEQLPLAIKERSEIWNDLDSQIGVFTPSDEIPLPDSGYFLIDVILKDNGLAELPLVYLSIPEGYIVVWYRMDTIETRIQRKWSLAVREITQYGLLTAVITWLVITLALSPIRRIARLSRELSASKLDTRIPLKHEPAEFDELIIVLNEMLDRLRENFTRVSQFSENASHELKTPLTVLQAQLEVYLNQAEDGSDEQVRIIELLEEVQKLIQITETLLLLSKSDRKALLTTRERFNLSDTAHSVYDLITHLDQSLTYEESIDPEVIIEGDPQLIHQLVMNLATNAVRYNRKGGRVVISLKKQDAGALIEVTNSGKAIPADKVKRIFDRFYRVDSGRSREAGGHGLGLNLAMEIARAHGGKLSLSNNQKDDIRFSVVLPEQVART